MISKAGRPEDGTDPKLISMAEFLVDLKPESEWTRKVTKKQVMDEMEAEITRIPGMLPSFSQPIRDNVNENIELVRSVPGANLLLNAAVARANR